MRLPPAPPARDRRQAPRESPSAKRDSLGNIPPSAATAKPALLLTCGLRDNALVYKLLCYEKLIGSKSHPTSPSTVFKRVKIAQQPDFASAPAHRTWHRPLHSP